jgi:hypothetical protein
MLRSPLPASAAALLAASGIEDAGTWEAFTVSGGDLVEQLHVREPLRPGHSIGFEAILRLIVAHCLSVPGPKRCREPRSKNVRVQSLDMDGGC